MKNTKTHSKHYKLLFILLLASITGLLQEVRINDTLITPITFENTFSPISSIRRDWEETLNYGGNDTGQSIITDSLGNVYITGKGYNISKRCYDIVIAKYNNSGSLKWTREWGGPSDDLGYGISVDSSNNVYVVGWTASYSNGSNDIVLLKYNSSGDFEWNRTWGGASDDLGYDLTIDSSNKIYVCGYSESFDENGDIIIMNYDDQGNLEWNRTWGDNTTDFAYGIVTDLQGNLYVTGYTDDNISAYTDLLLLKYNTSGDLVWNTTWGGDLQEEGWDVVSDGNNTIYIVGGTKSYGGGGRYNTVILAFNSSGVLLWNTTWGGAQNDLGYGISLNLENELCITGTTKSFGDVDNGNYYLLKYNTSGHELWNKTWGDASIEIGYDITIDMNNNIFITGVKGTDIYTVRFLPAPDDIVLISDAGSPDSDGAFNLSWGTSLEADNYSIYQSNEYISEPNSSLEINSGNTNRTYSLNNLSERDYYFLVVAFNTYGNTSSNCLKIIVKFPPGCLILTHTADTPDHDGTFFINWMVSERAENYSIYRSSQFIHDIDNNGTLIIKGLTNQSYYFSEEIDSSHYYVIVAYNEAGKNISNCIQIIIGRTPTIFNLSIDADDPDTDGRFYLIWNPSIYTKNYTIFYYDNIITEINSSLEILEIGLEQSENPLFIPVHYIFEYHGWSNGTYYFIIVAYNIYGNYTSNCIKLVIGIPAIENNGNDEIPDNMDLVYYGGVILLGIVITGLTLTSILRKRKHSTLYKPTLSKPRYRVVPKNREKSKLMTPQKNTNKSQAEKIRHNPKRKNHS